MERDAKRMLLEYNKETKRLDDLYRCAAKQCGISECAFWSLYTLRAEERQFTQAEICEFLIEADGPLRAEKTGGRGLSRADEQRGSAEQACGADRKG